MLHVSFGSKIRPRTVGCVDMGSAVLFILMSRLLFYFAGFGMNMVEVVLSGFSVRLFCLVKNLMLVWLYVFLGCTRSCVCVCRCDCYVICVDQCFPTGAPRSPCAPWCIVKGSTGDDITNKFK